MKWTSKKITKKQMEMYIRSGNLKRVGGYGTRMIGAKTMIERFVKMINSNEGEFRDYIKLYRGRPASTMYNFGGWSSTKVSATEITNPKQPNWKFIIAEFPQTEALNIYLYNELG